MHNPFFEHPILNSPYEYPQRHWERDPSGHTTQQVLERRRRAESITPIPKSNKRKRAMQPQQKAAKEQTMCCFFHAGCVCSPLAVC